MVSFTNIGADEITSKVQNVHGLTVAGDGYAGTIHAFLQRYVLTPFAHRLTGSKVAVRIDPRSVELQDPDGVKSQDYTFHVDGSIRFNDPAKGAPHNHQLILNVKLAAAKEGVVSSNDALYWAVRVLAEVPGAATALALRFDEIIVDEAQDTTEFQLMCLGWLRSAGLGSLVLVGDYDQSIYGFNGARRDLCQKFSDEWDLLPKLLTENYRSSQEICNVAGRLRGMSPADTAVGPHKAFGVPPQVFSMPQETKAMWRSASKNLLSFTASTQGTRPFSRPPTIFVRLSEVRNRICYLEIYRSFLRRRLRPAG